MRNHGYRAVANQEDQYMKGRNAHSKQRGTLLRKRISVSSFDVATKISRWLKITSLVTAIQYMPRLGRYLILSINGLAHSGQPSWAKTATFDTQTTQVILDYCLLDKHTKIQVLGLGIDGWFPSRAPLGDLHGSIFEVPTLAVGAGRNLTYHNKERPNCAI